MGTHQAWPELSTKELAPGTQGGDSLARGQVVAEEIHASDPLEDRISSEREINDDDGGRIDERAAASPAADARMIGSRRSWTEKDLVTCILEPASDELARLRIALDEQDRTLLLLRHVASLPRRRTVISRWQPA